MPVYVDTSALAKRYIAEVDSDRFESFLMAGSEPLHICPLTVTEFHSLLMRRQRLGEVDTAYLEQARAAFAADITSGLWHWNTFPAEAFGDACLLIQQQGVVLSTLDALHLACAQLLGCEAMATADRQLARAATQRGLHLHQFAG